MLEFLSENMGVYGVVIGSIAGVAATVIGCFFLKNAKASKNDIRLMIVFIVCLTILIDGWLLVSFNAPPALKIIAAPIYVVLLLSLVLTYSLN